MILERLLHRITSLLMRNTPAIGSRVADSHRVCAESEKNTRAVTPFVQSIGFLNKSPILFGEETRTHVCHAVYLGFEIHTPPDLRLLSFLS